MFERFTEKAIKVIFLAQAETRRLGHNRVGTEILLLGLIGEGTGIAAKTLKSMGVNLNYARVEVEKIIGRGSGSFTVELQFTPRSERVVELSWDEARRLNSNYIDTGHLLLALIREGEEAAVQGVAVRVLENLGINPTKIRDHVLRLLGGQPNQEAISQGFACLMPINIRRACPNCAESIKAEAYVCHFCGYGLSDEYFVECKFCRERIRKGAVRCKHCRAVLGDRVE